MGVKHISYLDIPLADRKKNAEIARQRIRAQLSNPFLAPDQSSHLHDQLDHISRWEAGEVVYLAEPGPPQLPPASEP